MSIIQLAEEREEFVEDVDGFVYWWPDRVKGQGYLSEGNLRELADELARRNKAWQETIERDMKPPVDEGEEAYKEHTQISGFLP